LAERRLIVAAIVAGVPLVALLFGACLTGGTLLALRAHRHGDPATQAATTQSAAPDRSRSPAAPPARLASGEHLVTLEVTGDGPVFVIYLAFPDDPAPGAPREVDDVVPPWRLEGTMPSSRGMVTLGVGRELDEPGSVTCRLLVDHMERMTATGTGPRAIANCWAVLD
jgi:hypothetical protein